MRACALLPNAITDADMLRQPDPDLPERRGLEQDLGETMSQSRLLHSYDYYTHEPAGSWSRDRVICLTCQRASVPKQSMPFGNNRSTWISRAVGDQLGIDLARVRRARSDAN